MSLLTMEEFAAMVPRVEWATEDEIAQRRETDLQREWEEWYAMLPPIVNDDPGDDNDHLNGD